MKYRIDPDAPESAYLQLYRQLRQDLVSGELPFGTRLPSKRLLAGELGVSLVTVEHAYALLCDEGYVEARERSGYFASFGGRLRRETPLPPLPAAESLEAPPEDFPFSVLARTMRRVLADYDRRILLRSPGPGTPELRAAIAAYILRTRGLSVPPERIVVGAGAEYLYSLIAQLFGRGTVFALEDPCYRRIRQVYEANGIRCLALPMGEDGIVSDALAACEAEVLHVTPFESFPSRVTASAGKRHEYAAWARGRGGRLRLGVRLRDKADRHHLLARAGARPVPQQLLAQLRALDAHGLPRSAREPARALSGAPGLLLLHGPGLRAVRPGRVHRLRRA